MALTLAQYEEIATLLARVPQLVDRLEVGRGGFAEAVLAWLKQVELTLENNRVPTVSQVASCRATLIAAIRGFAAKEVTISGRSTRRKVRDATATLVLERSNELLHAVVSDRRAVFQEAERIAQQLVAIAAAKGYVQKCENRHQPTFLSCLQQNIASDRDLVSVYSHLLALVGKTDIVVFLDRALPKVV